MNFIDKEYIEKSRTKYPGIWKLFDTYCKKKSHMSITNSEVGYLFKLYAGFINNTPTLQDFNLYSFKNSYQCLVYNFSYKQKIYTSTMNPIDTLVSFFRFYESMFTNTPTQEEVHTPTKEKIMDDTWKTCIEIIESKFGRAYSTFVRYCYTNELNHMKMDSLYGFFESFNMKITNVSNITETKKNSPETRYKWSIINTYDDTPIYYIITKTDWVPRSLVYHGFCSIDVEINKFIHNTKYAEQLS